MDIMQAMKEQQRVISEMKDIPVYSPEWWQKIQDTLTVVDPGMRQMIVFAVVYGSIQM